jgi:glycosyltransferase involved in cell wall biosynthesis
MRILLLAYYFPPIGGAGAQRNTKLARYLPESGHALTVVTGPGSIERRWTPFDLALLDEVSPEVDVLRIHETEPSRGAVGRRAIVERWLRLRTEWRRWWNANATRVAIEAGGDADVVLASLAPFETADAAIEVARRLRKPLVLDLEDPWALDEMLIQETGLHAHLELRAMRKALVEANGIIMNTPEAAVRVRERFPELVRIPVTSILNGYDAADFTRPPAPHGDGSFRIVHTGSLHSWGRPRFARRVLGGAASGVDVLSRSLTYLLAALEGLVKDRPELRDRIEVHVAGKITSEDRHDIGQPPVALHDHGFLPHAGSISLMKSADLLFLPMHDLPGGRVAIVPCKTYEYLASGRPILAAVPDGDARDLLQEAGNAFLARPTDVEALKDGLVKAVARWEGGERPPVPAASVLERTERRHLTDELVTFLGEVVTATRGAGSSG